MAKENEYREDNYEETEASQTNVEEQDTDEGDDGGETGEGTDEQEEAKEGADENKEEDADEQTVDYWKERAEKAEKAIEKSKRRDKKDSKQQQESSDEITLSRLEARGIMEEEDQDVIRKHAKVEGMSAIEALNDPFIKARLEHNKEARKKKASSAKPSNRTGGGDRSDDVGYWTRQLENKGKEAPTSEMRKQVRERLAGKS